MHYAFYIIPLLLVISIPSAFAQVETVTFPNGTTFETPNIIIPDPIPEPVILGIYDETKTSTIYLTEDNLGLIQFHYPYFETEQGEFIPYRLTQNDSMIQVEFSDGKIVFDKIAGATTLFYNGLQVVDSDSYLVRTAELNTDVWNFLDVNDSPVETIIEEDGDKVTVTFRQQNNEGIFDVEYVIQGEIKTTAKFTNFIYPNHKFAFTETLNLSDNTITLNDQEINLDGFVGQTFPREILEQNEDLVLEAKDLFYNSGIGFDQLWSVGIFENNKISLDYANVEQTQTPIGQTVELDPTWQSPSSGTINSTNCTGSNNNNFAQATDNANYNTGSYNAWQGVTCGGSGAGSFSKTMTFDLGQVYDISQVKTYHSGYGWWGGTNLNVVGSANGVNFYSHSGNAGYNAGNTNVFSSTNNVNQQSQYISYTISGSDGWKSLVETRVYVALPTYAPTAPQSLTTSQSVANEIILNYQAPSSDGGASITNYKIYLNGSLIDTIGNVLTYTDSISGNEIGANLVYSVKAVNSVGDSPASSNSNITSWDVPDQVTGLTAQTGYPIILNWNVPASDDTITNYEIKRDSSVIATVGSVTTYSDSPPTTGATYSYEISAISAVGQGAYSSTVNGIAGVSADAPSLALAHDSSNLNIEVTITNGASMGTGTFTSYTVERSADGSTNWTSVGTPTTTSFIDTVPSSGNWYYRAATTTTHGTSAYSSVVNIAHVDPDLPSITASYYDPNSSDIQVVITNGASFGTGTFTSYTVERSADGSTNWTSVGTPTVSPFIDTTTPSVGDWYYRAATITTHGTSAYSSNALASPVAPDAPTNLTSVISNPNPNPLTISLDWDSPINFGSGTLTGYEVYRDGSLITTTGTASQYDDTVSVQGTYVYTIKTVTNHAVSSLSGSTTISTPTQPSADSSVTLSIDNPNPNPLDVTVSFVAPSSNGGSTITGYNLSSSPDDITYTQIATGVTTPQTVTVSSAGTWYFKSQAVNNVGMAGLGSAVSITTPSVPNAVTDLATSSVNDTVIGLTWTAPINGGSNIIDYDVLRDGVTIATVTTPGYSDTGLTTQTSYVYEVFARNNVGFSLISNQITQVTEGVPAVVPNFQTTTASLEAITLSWTAPNDYGSVITGYLIERESPTGNGFSTLTTTGVVTTYSDIGLTPVTEYNYRISAINAYGNSPTTTSSTITLPAPPTNVFVTPSSSTSELTITWDEPTLTTGITGYQILRENGVGSGFTPVTIVSGTNHTDTGLSTNVYYNYKLKSVTVQGNSESSNTYSQTTYHLPNAVESLTATSGELIDASLSWQSPTVPYGYITGYEIYQSTTGTPNTLIDTTTATTFTATDLDPTVTYYWLVAPVTIHGSNSTGNIANATATSEIIIGDIELSADVNPDVASILFDQVRTGNSTALTVTYPNTYDLTCEFDYKFARSTQSFSNLIPVTISPTHNSHTFNFNNSANEIISARCYNENTNPGGINPNDSNDGKDQINFSTQPIVTQVNDFQKGLYGISGGFGAFDLMTLFVVIVSMVGFNRKNPAVGVGIMVTFIGAMAYFGVIETPTIVMGAIALVAVLAIGIARNKL